MGNTQPYDPGMGPQSSITRPRHWSATGGGTGLQLQAEIDLPEPYSHVVS